MYVYTANAQIANSKFGKTLILPKFPLFTLTNKYSYTIHCMIIQLWINNFVHIYVHVYMLSNMWWIFFGQYNSSTKHEITCTPHMIITWFSADSELIASCCSHMILTWLSHVLLQRGFGRFSLKKKDKNAKKVN